MKKIIVSIVLSLIVATVAAQTNYYPNEEGIISKSGYTYGYRSEKMGDIVMEGRLQIFNTDNKYLDVEWGKKDGSELSYENRFGIDGDGFQTLHASTGTLSIGELAIVFNNCLSTQEKAILKGSFMTVICRIDTSTGKVADVYFSFFRLQPGRFIPVDTYRSIELAIKQRLSFTMTAEGQRLNYMQIFWRQMF